MPCVVREPGWLEHDVFVGAMTGEKTGKAWIMKTA